MGRPKGGTNKSWSKEQKYEYVKLVMEGIDSCLAIAKANNMSAGMLSTWIKKYKEGGLEALENKHKPRNPLVKFQRRKELNELEKLQFENMKLKIENARLKKGYTNEEVIAAKQNMKSKKNMK